MYKAIGSESSIPLDRTFGEKRIPTRSMPMASPTAVRTLVTKRRRLSIDPPYSSVAMVGGIAQELVDQIAVGAVHLDAVEAGGDRIAGGVGIIADDPLDIGLGQRARLDVGLRPS